MSAINNKPIILLAEDDVFVVSIYQTKLEKEGFTIAVAENGLEALKQLEKITPVMILLDIMMPYLDGIGVLKKIKESDEWRDIPVIMLTNLSEKEKMDEAMAMGASDYLIKSHFTPSEVMIKIREILDNKKAKEKDR